MIYNIYIQYIVYGQTKVVKIIISYSNANSDLKGSHESPCPHKHESPTCFI
jgi:hypothetical protein